MKSKKGAAWIAYILATGFFVALATGTILWYTSFAEETTQATVKYVEGKMDCRNVRIASDLTPDQPCSPPPSVGTLYNKGTLNIEKIMVQHKASSEEKDIKILVNGEAILNPAITLNTNNPYAYIIPIIKVGKDYVGCTDKKLKLSCSP